LAVDGHVIMDGTLLRCDFRTRNGADQSVDHDAIIGLQAG
jgi:hypothetical protein